MIDVTVSIVHASRPELTLECLESLVEDHRRRCSVEIVALDNASGDQLAAAVRSRFSGIRVIEQSFRAGFGANHNSIIRASDSRYVFVLNADTRVPPGTIDALVEYLDAHPEAAVAGPQLRGFDGRPQDSAWPLMTIPVQLAWSLTLGRFGGVVRGTTTRPVGAVSACAMLARRDALEEVGLFDEAYFMFSEEADLAQRFERRGLERHYVPGVEVLHHRHQSTAQVPERQVNELWRSLDVYLARYHSRAEGRVLRWLIGLGYALAAAAGELACRLPARVRPSAASSSNRRVYRLHVRNAYRGIREPGLRELAEDWNRSHRPRGEPVAGPPRGAEGLPP